MCMYINVCVCILVEKKPSAFFTFIRWLSVYLRFVMTLTADAAEIQIDFSPLYKLPTQRAI